MKRIHRVVQVLFFAVLFALNASAAAYAGIVFGPETYDRTTGKPDVYTAHFSASEGKGLLRIINGNPDGGARVTSAYLDLNGQSILATNDFKNGAPLIEQEVDLAAANSVEIELRSGPDTFLTLEVEQEGLFVTIECTPDTIYAGQQATLRWSSSQADRASIDNGIGEVALSGSRVVSPGTTTTYTITATAPDGSVASEQATLTVLDPPAPEVTLESSKTEILPGESVTLSWSSRHVDECTLAPGIGAVDLNGSVTLTPSETTTYILTGRGPGGAATAAVTVTVSYPLPELTFSASSTEISYGDTVVLTWTSQYADACEISPGIGPVALEGSKSVMPDKTTTYVLSASGPGGEARKSGTVTVLNPPPTVSFSASPASIIVGESAVLTWSVENATSVKIEPGIGPVDLSGNYEVTPIQTTTYTLTATGYGGTVTAASTVAVVPISVSIDSPLDGDSLFRPEVMVQGTLTNPLGNEIGVSVNGIAALVSGNQFIANDIALEEGLNTITAIATDSSGNTATASLTINAQITDDYIKVEAGDELGVAPFETILRVGGSFRFTDSVISNTGPEGVEILAGTGDNEYRIEVAVPGIYIFTVQAVDDQNITHTDTVAIAVYDRAQVNMLLQAKWDGMKTALVNGEIETALTYILENRREKYAMIYGAIGSELPRLVQQMRGISPILIEGDRAKYRIKQDHVIKGQTVTISYYLYFSRDESGLWRIDRY